MSQDKFVYIILVKRNVKFPIGILGQPNHCGLIFWPLAPVSRTFRDEDGFMVTKKEMASASESDNEADEAAAVSEASKQKRPEPVVKTPEKSKGKAGNSNAAAASKKQASIMNFFKKKWEIAILLVLVISDPMGSLVSLIPDYICFDLKRWMFNDKLRIKYLLRAANAWAGLESLHQDMC